MNYGAIGAVIGHEISHGFDDQGAQYDGDGNLRDWWTKDDHEKFTAKTKALVAEYNAFEPVPGYQLNGAADPRREHRRQFRSHHRLQGVSVVARRQAGAGNRRLYRRSALLHRLRARSGARRLRDNFAIELIKSDPHSIPVDRVLGTVVNQEGFYKAFDIKAGDKMFVAPDKRVSIW